MERLHEESFTLLQHRESNECAFRSSESCLRAMRRSTSSSCPIILRSRASTKKIWEDDVMILRSRASTKKIWEGGEVREKKLAVLGFDTVSVELLPQEASRQRTENLFATLVGAYDTEDYQHLTTEVPGVAFNRRSIEATAVYLAKTEAYIKYAKQTPARWGRWSTRQNELGPTGGSRASPTIRTNTKTNDIAKLGVLTSVEELAGLTDAEKVFQNDTRTAEKVAIRATTPAVVVPVALRWQ